MGSFLIRCLYHVVLDKAVPCHPCCMYCLLAEPLASYIYLQSTIQGFILPGEHGKRVLFLQYAHDAICVALSITDISQFLTIFDLFQKAACASFNVGRPRV